ncbi:hypothetical protein [Burkholderia lata]|uniref:hypothetical protein n=1 Tax=Burkholderia lata (strain ATCC 17760 / DSM 23089 / LMG 22485 / NCIMB 9086 / R18194 / 383) TaxID=482957 RepID=UPI00158203A9|nr:hypothetical protein [Burkholderia lata]
MPGWLHAHAVQCLWFWHTSPSDRQDHFAGQFTGQRFSFLGARSLSDALSSQDSITRLRASPHITPTMQQYLRRT